MHQMGLSQTDAAIQEQRVEPRAGWLFGNPLGAGVGELVRLADHETIERETRVQRTGEFHARVGAIVRPHGEREQRRRFGQRRHDFSERPDRRHGAADADFHPPHGRVLGMPEGIQAVAIVAADPVAQEAGRQVDRDLVAFEADQGHLAQPCAIFDVSHLGLQPAPDMRPLSSELRRFHDFPLLGHLDHMLSPCDGD